jgi:hypothetical protein
MSFPFPDIRKVVNVFLFHNWSRRVDYFNFIIKKAVLTRRIPRYVLLFYVMSNLFFWLQLRAWTMSTEWRHVEHSKVAFDDTKINGR